MYTYVFLYIIYGILKALDICVLLLIAVEVEGSEMTPNYLS